MFQSKVGHKDTFYFHYSFTKIMSFMRKCDKTLPSRSGHRWQYSTARAHFILDN